MNNQNEPSATLSKYNLSKMIKKRLVILRWLPLYTKFDAVSDIIAGITVGLTMMPQSMAYAALANLPTHYGLYSSFMGAFIYMFFGTIKEVSIGPTSLMALLTLSYTQNLPMDFIILLCFLCGWVEFLMGVFKLGFLVDFISAPALSGFTSATSIIIILAQLKGLVGIKFNSDNIFHYVQKFFACASEIKTSDTVLGVTCLVVLLILRRFKDTTFKNRSIKKAFWFLSIGRNALIVLLASILAGYFENRNGKSLFTLTGNVTPGIPSFRLPNFSTKVGNETVSFTEMVQTLGTGIIVMPLVAVLANVAIAKAFASGKNVDATQEMITLGLCNIFGSFVQSMPTCGAFTRSAVANSSGIRTPLAGLYAGTIILLALTFLTPYFYYVPKSTLAAVLISAVVFMIDYKILLILWKSNKFDFVIMVVTFIICLVYGVEHGLLVGVLVNFIPLLKLWTRPKVEYFVCTSKTTSQYLVIKPELGLYFSGVDHLTREVFKITSSIIRPAPIVIDCANIIRVDYTAAKALNGLVKEMKKKNRPVLFLKVKLSVLNSLLTFADENEICCCDSEDDIHNFLAQVKIEDSVEIALLPSKDIL